MEELSPMVFNASAILFATEYVHSSQLTVKTPLAMGLIFSCSASKVYKATMGYSGSHTSRYLFEPSVRGKPINLHATFTSLTLYVPTYRIYPHSFLSYLRTPKPVLYASCQFLNESKFVLSI